MSRAMEKLNSFCKGFGAKINTRKSTLMLITNTKPLPKHIDLKEEKELVKILGVYWGKQWWLIGDKKGGLLQ